MMNLFVVASICLLFAEGHVLDKVLDLACRGYLEEAEQLTIDMNSVDETDLSSAGLHVQSGFEFMLHGNVSSAIKLHKSAKLLGATQRPPLAGLHLDGATCGGLGDLFYVSAVCIKTLVDSLAAEEEVLSCHKTMITLSSDSGLFKAAEAHYHEATEIAPKDPSLLMRGILLTPSVYLSQQHVTGVRHRTLQRIQELSSLQCFDSSDDSGCIPLVLKQLDEFSLSPTFYYVYQGLNDRDMLSSIHTLYTSMFPALLDVSSFNSLPQATSGPSPLENNAPITVGFVSSYFRRHSICKLWCGVIRELAKVKGQAVKIVIFSAMPEQSEDEVTATLKNLASVTFLRVGKTLISNRGMVLAQKLDVLVYLDVGMEPATSTWAAARLAPIQICTWGHPTTTGMETMDFYVSSDLFHSSPTQHRRLSNSDAFDLPFHLEPQAAFREQVVSLSALGFYFTRPILVELIGSVGVAAINNEKMLNRWMKSMSVVDDAHADTTADDDMLQICESHFKAWHAGGTDSVVTLSKRDQHFCEYHYQLIWREQVDVTTSSTRPYYSRLASAPITPRTTKGARQLKMLVELKVSPNVNVATDLALTFPQELSENVRITYLLCPQHLSKFHPSFDNALLRILQTSPFTVLVMLNMDKHTQWRRTLERRWGNWSYSHASPPQDCSKASECLAPASLLDRVVWVDRLNPSEYLTMLALADVMVDPFPFGGGVTTLEAFAVCTPVITYPAAQSVPGLSAGMLRYMNDKYLTNLLVVRSSEQYIYTALSLLSSASESQAVRRKLCGKVYKIFEDQSSVNEWSRLLRSVALG